MWGVAAAAPARVWGGLWGVSWADLSLTRPYVVRYGVAAASSGSTTVALPAAASVSRDGAAAPAGTAPTAGSDNGGAGEQDEDEYDHDDDCGYRRFEVTNAAAFAALQLVDTPGGLVQGHGGTLGPSTSSHSRKSGSAPPGVHPSHDVPDDGEWRDAVEAAQPLRGRGEQITSGADGGPADPPRDQASPGQGPADDDVAPDDAARRRHAAMQRFFQAQEEVQTSSEAATSSDAHTAQACGDGGARNCGAEDVPARQVPGESSLMGRSGDSPLAEGAGGFTFSPPVGAPSPPMSMAGFSFRSATSDSAGSDGDHDDDDDQHSDTSIGRHSAIGTTPAASPSPPLERGRSDERHSMPSATETGGIDNDDGSGSQAAPVPAATHTAHSPGGGGIGGGEEDGLEAFELRVVAARRRTGFEAEKDFPITLGSVVAGRYQITEYLGSAAFSRAVQAHDLQTGALVCLKIIKNSKDFFDQSLDEIKLLKLLNAADPGDEHGVLRMFDAFYFKEHLFIATELLRANLYEFQRHNLESGEPHYFTPARLRRIARQVLQALAFVHAQGVLHCDLKPENILFRSFSRCVVKVIDFGSSCFMGDHPSSYVQSRSYRAPEVILGAAYDYRIDIWSVGCILAELHTGRVLFQNDSLASLLARVVGICGPLPPRLLAARHAHKYFTRSGDVFERDPDTGACFVLRPKACHLRHRLTAPDGSPPESEFVEFVVWLLTLDPEARPTAEDALRHPWLNTPDALDTAPSADAAHGHG